MNIAKIQKDLETITDIVLMQEMRDTSQALQILNKKAQLIQGEMNRRIEANIKVTAEKQNLAGAGQMPGMEGQG